MSWIKFEDRKPDHKDLVLVDIGIGVALPAIFYNNNSFNGFYKFTKFYHWGATRKTPYDKVPLKPHHKIDGVIKWMNLPETEG